VTVVEGIRSGARRVEEPRRGPVGRPPAIGLDDVVAAATIVAEEVGVDGVTMNLVAERLEVTSAALYHYVANKQELVNLVIEGAFAQVEPPPRDAGSWDERLRIFERDVRAKVRRLKWGTPRVLQDGEAPDSLRRLFGIAREIMDEAGADEREVTLAFATVYAFMIGQLWFDSATTGPDRQRPQIRVAEQTGLDSDELFEFGLDVVITGLRVRLTPSVP
jgi:AcrR family transcriptional regulator